MRSRVRVVIWILACVVILTSCGVSADPEPSVIDRDEFTPTTIPSPAEPPGSAETVVVYFLRGGKLAPVFKRVAQTSVPERRLRNIAVQLSAGPDRLEQRQGYRTSLNQVDVNVRNLIAGQVTVDIGQEFPGNGTTQITAVAQIVATLTAVPGVGKVQFQVQGLDAGRLLDASGAAIDQPVSFDSYASLVTPMLDETPVSVDILFAGTDGALSAVRRTIARHADPTEQGRLVVRALNAGPTDEESRRGLRSAVEGLCQNTPAGESSRGSFVPDTTRAGVARENRQCAVLARVTDGTAVIDLGDAYGSMSDSQRAQALAALVGTITGLPRIGVVSFVANAVEVTVVPNAVGQPRPLPVSRDDYASLLPAAPSEFLEVSR